MVMARRPPVAATSTVACVAWRAGEIEIDGKGHERARLRFPANVGDALVAYLMLRGRHDTH
jgi:hypothetical protein